MRTPPMQSVRTFFVDWQHLGSARELVAANRRVDDDIKAILPEVHERYIHDEWSERPRTVAQQLGHLGEFPVHVAGQLEEWLSGRRIVLGRGELDPDLENGIALASRSRLSPLLDAIDDAGEALARTFAQLTDDHLRATVHHVSRGREPLATFLSRCVLQHKRSHHVELAETLAGLPAERAG